MSEQHHLFYSNGYAKVIIYRLLIPSHGSFLYHLRTCFYIHLYNAIIRFASLDKSLYKVNSEVNTVRIQAYGFRAKNSLR